MSQTPAADLIGASLPRPKARQLAAGRGRYLDDLRLPGMLHAAFLRSPHAHARLVSLDLSVARALAGVAAVFGAADLRPVCRPWLTHFPNLPAHRSVPQPPLVEDRALWQGQAVAVVVAESRAIAEDAVALIEAEWEPLPALASGDAALAPDAPVLHEPLGDNLLFQHRIDAGDTAGAIRDAAHVVRASFRFPRHTGVPLESRALVAEFDASLESLTVHASTQVPHQMRALLARQFALPEHQVRVIVPDVGGGFGIKLHCYDDEMATVAAAVLLGRPVKFVCDRLESFASDIHARDHVVDASLAVSSSGRMLAFRVDDLTQAGAYSCHPRSSALEGLQAISAVGAPYATAAHEARLRVAFQNKPMTASYRGVGQPVACGVTELLVDAAARRLAIDPAEFRRMNYRVAARDGMRTPGGVEIGAELTLEACLDRLLQLMDYRSLRQRQQRERAAGRHLGIGLATFIEQSAPGSAMYGTAAIPISASDGCSVRLEADGAVTCVTSTQFQGQGVETGLAQLVAHTLAVPFDSVRIVHGDTAATPLGGGTWASRGLAIGGEAALAAAQGLRERLIGAASALLEAAPGDLELADGAVRVRGTDRALPLAELGFTLHYRPHLLPPGASEPMVTRHAQPSRPYFVANGIQASLVEVDTDTGFVTLLGHWLVEDCGRIVNPLLVDEQLRGGVVQGIGAALFEECLYDGEGQLLTATMADYLVPMAAEMPDIVIGHVETPVPDTLLGGKGVGEASIVGAAAAVANAVNDALAPLLPATDAPLAEMPMTPERILRALGRVA